MLHRHKIDERVIEIEYNGLDHADFLRCERILSYSE
jgi:hypothetical protein